MMRSVQVTGVDFDVRNCVHDLNKLWRKLNILPEVDLIPDSDRAEIHRPPRDWRDRFFAYQKAYLPPPLKPPGQPTHVPPIKGIYNINFRCFVEHHFCVVLSSSSPKSTQN